MILVDANLLLYAVNADSPRHQPARVWLEETLSGTTRVGLAWIVVLAFTRISTRSGIFSNPLSPSQSLAFVESWLEQPIVELVVPGREHWSVFRRLVADAGTAGNLTSDAHLAALAIEHGFTIYSSDDDFRRFSGIDHVNPLA